MTRWVYDPVQKLWPRVLFYTSKDLKTWSAPVWCEPWGIDPALFHDPVSGNSYLSLMAPNNNKDRLWGIYQCQIDLKTGQCIGPYIGLWNGTMEHTASARPEGPKMIYKDGYYYLLIAEGGTDELHRASIARSKSPEGPFEPAPHNPVLHNGRWGVRNLTVQSTGHATLVDTPDGKWYASFLARRNVNGSSPLGREAFLTPVEWNDDGWPVFNKNQPITLSQSFGPGPDQSRVPKRFIDNFDDATLHPEWYQLRIPYTKNYKLHGRKGGRGGGLTLVPNVFGLSDRDTPAALLRKQKSLNMTFSATLKSTTKPLNIRQSVGISAYQSDLVHHDLGVSGCRNSPGVCLYTSLLMNGTTTVSHELPQYGRST
jgi:beta-xylosidase